MVCTRYSNRFRLVPLRRKGNPSTIQFHLWAVVVAVVHCQASSTSRQLSFLLNHSTRGPKQNQCSPWRQLPQQLVELIMNLNGCQQTNTH